MLVRRTDRTLRIAAWVGGVLIVMLLGALALATRAPRHAHRKVPAFTGAYVTGGVPVRDAELEQLLSTELPALVAAVDGDRHGDDKARIDHASLLAAAPAIRHRGEALADAWQAMLEALDRYAGAPLHWKGYKDAEAELRARTHDVADELASLGLAYYIDAAVYVDHGVAHAAIFSYRVELVSYLRAAGERRRVLSLRRLDHLNLERALLGMHSEELGDPIVLLDQIDELVRTHVDPLRRFQLYPLGDDMWRDSRDGQRLASAASGAVAAELATTPDPTAALAASVRRHEVRHAIDQQRDKPLRYPSALAQYLGHDADDPFVRHVRAELSAYLSQLANEPAMPQLVLWNLASLTFRHDRWGTPESYAGLVILEGLARAEHRKLVYGGALDRGRLAELALPLASLPDAALRDAARALWAELYGESFLPITEELLPLRP